MTQQLTPAGAASHIPNRFASIEDYNSFLKAILEKRDALQYTVPRFISEEGVTSVNPAWEQAPYEEVFLFNPSSYQK